MACVCSLAYRSSVSSEPRTSPLISLSSYIYIYKTYLCVWVSSIGNWLIVFARVCVFVSCLLLLRFVVCRWFSFDSVQSLLHYPHAHTHTHTHTHTTHAHQQNKDKMTLLRQAAHPLSSLLHTHTHTINQCYTLDVNLSVCVCGLIR